MEKSKRKKRLWDTYRYPGFTPSSELSGVFGDPKARVIRFKRRQKKQPVGSAVRFIGVGTTASDVWFAIFRVAITGSIWLWTFGGSYAGSVGP
jgi:hypothetical protein